MTKLLDLAYSWSCYEPDCGHNGHGPNSHRDADKHCKTTGHAVHAWARPVERPTTTGHLLEES